MNTTTTYDNLDGFVTVVSNGRERRVLAKYASAPKAEWVSFPVETRPLRCNPDVIGEVAGDFEEPVVMHRTSPNGEWFPVAPLYLTDDEIEQAQADEYDRNIATK